MKAKIIFDLDDPNDLMSFKRCCKADDMASALFEILHNTKKGVYYTIDENPTTDRYDVVDLVYSRIYELMEINDINIDKLIE